MSHREETRTAFNYSPELMAHLEKVMRATSEVTGVPWLALLSARKIREWSGAAQIMRGAIRKTTGLSYPKIAYLLGLNHSTLLYVHVTRHKESIERVAAIVGPFDGSIYARPEYRCQCCGQRKAVVIAGV